MNDEKAPKSLETEDFIWIASYSGQDRITGIHMMNLFQPFGISAVCGGSLIYGVSVPKHQVKKAITILRKDVIKHHYLLSLKKDEFYPAPPLKVMVKNISFKSLGNQLYIRKTVDLQRFLRHSDIAKLGNKYLFVHTLSVQEREYLAIPHLLKHGYEVEIELRKTSHKDSDSFKGRYQVYNDGKQVDFWWSSGWEV